MIIARSAVTFVAGATLLLGAALPAAAASPTTQAFLADVMPSVDFLDRSSRLALDNSQSPRLKDFAKGEAREQTLAANALDAWIDQDKVQAVAATAGPDGLLTGRSVAIDTPAPVVAPAFPPVSQEDFDRMYGLTGAEFDQSYKATQMDSLKHLVAAYQEYITNGDEPTLKALATSELPKINRKLAELNKL